MKIVRHCAWCGLGDVEEFPVDPAQQLCRACARVLAGREWRRLLPPTPESADPAPDRR
jgi:hypothetical protein